MLANQHHPQTIPAITLPTGAPPVQLPLQSRAHTRIGSSIELTGLSIDGYLQLGSEAPATVVQIAIYKADMQLDTVTLLPTLSQIRLRREIDGTERTNKVMSKTWVLNHRAENASVKVPVNLYYRFKAGKRIKYNDGQTTTFPSSEAHYQDDRYYMVIRSDKPDLVVGGGIPASIPNSQLNAVLDANVTFCGKYTAYYRDS